VRVFTHRALLQFAARRPEAAEPPDFWYRIAKRARWSHLAGVRKVFPHADSVAKWTVFNVKGNKYRLVTEINYAKGFVFVRDFLTHAEYDRGAWKK
jgi:mRNA interferase HigB